MPLDNKVDNVRDLIFGICCVGAVAISPFIGHLIAPLYRLEPTKKITVKVDKIPEPYTPSCFILPVLPDATSVKNNVFLDTCPSNYQR